MKRVIAESQGSIDQLTFFFGTMVLVTFFFNHLGYPFSSFLLMLALLRILGVKKWTFSLLYHLLQQPFAIFFLSNGLKSPCQRGG